MNANHRLGRNPDGTTNPGFRYEQPRASQWSAVFDRSRMGFASAIARDNIFAVQFHPEKSAQAGLRLLANFTDWNP